MTDKALSISLTVAMLGLIMRAKSRPTRRNRKAVVLKYAMAWDVSCGEARQALNAQVKLPRRADHTVISW